MASHGNDVTRVSSYFSSFWASFSRKDLKIEAEGTTLYSFRHAFQDEISRIGHGDEIKKALMGHAEGGMTGRYGTKRRPRVVNIHDLDEAVQGAVWPFLKTVKRPAF
jgi:integrase